MLFVWSGKQASAQIKAQTLTKGYALDDYLKSAKDTGLNVLFSGGVIRNKKLQRGSIFLFEDVLEKNTTKYSRIADTADGASAEIVGKAHE